MWHYAFGKPQDQIELNGGEGKPVSQTLELTSKSPRPELCGPLSLSEQPPAAAERAVTVH